MDIVKDQSKSFINPLSKLVGNYGMSVAMGTEPIPTISDLNRVIKVKGLLLRREDDEDFDVVEYVSDPIVSSSKKKSYVLSVVPGLRVSDVKSHKHQTPKTELLRSSIFLKEGEDQSIVDSIDFLCTGPFNRPTVYQDALHDAAMKLLSKHL